MGMIQPVVRRIASRMRSIRPTPKTMSQVSGRIERSKNASPPAMRYAAVEMPAAASSQSQSMMRWR